MRSRRRSAANPKARSVPSHDVLKLHLAELGLEFIPEHRFHPERKWALDFYLPDRNWGIEIEGGVWSRGRHTRGQGFIDDMEKYNNAVLRGIKLLRFTTEQVLTGQAKEFLRGLLYINGRCVK